MGLLIPTDQSDRVPTSLPGVGQVRSPQGAAAGHVSEGGLGAAMQVSGQAGPRGTLPSGKRCGGSRRDSRKGVWDARVDVGGHLLNCGCRSLRQFEFMEKIRHVVVMY